MGNRPIMLRMTTEKTETIRTKTGISSDKTCTARKEPGNTGTKQGKTGTKRHSRDKTETAGTKHGQQVQSGDKRGQSGDSHGQSQEKNSPQLFLIVTVWSLFGLSLFLPRCFVPSCACFIPLLSLVTLSLFYPCFRHSKSIFFCAVKTLVLKFCARKSAKISLKIT